MKRIIYLLIFFPFICFGQVPQSMSYQAMATNSEGFEIANSQISVKISIIEETPSGLVSFVEEHTVTTDAYGMFSINIGQGNSEDDYTAVDWSKSNFLKVELDDNMDGAYSLMGVSAFNSVPYSYMAENVMNPDELKDNLGDHTATQTLDMDSNFVSQVMAPELPLDAANKQYVDGLINEVLQSSSMQLSTQSPESMNFGEALLYCDTLTEGGYTNWAIPSLEIVMFISGGGGELNGTRTSNYIWTSTSGFGYSGGGGVSYNLVFNILDGIHNASNMSANSNLSLTYGTWSTYTYARSYYTRCYR